MAYRSSKYIDFNSDTVITAPLAVIGWIPKPWSIETKIDIYECITDVWFFGPAIAMLRQMESHQPPSVWSHSAYSVVSMTFPYFQMIGKTLGSLQKPGEDFNRGFCDVYPAFTPSNGIYADHIVQSTGTTVPNPDIQAVIRFRDRIRNGVSQLGFIKWSVVLHNDRPHVADFEEKVIPDPVNPGQTITVYRVNPYAYVRTILDHFPGFIAQLRALENTTLRHNFEAFFDEFIAP